MIPKTQRQSKMYSCIFKFTGIALCLVVLSFNSYSQRTASVSGDWSNTATWGGLSVPISTDAVTINSNITVTVDIPAALCASITISASAGTGFSNSLIISGTNALTVGGSVTMNNPTATSSGTINVGDGTITATSFTLSGSNATSRVTQILINNGTVNSTGNITNVGAGGKVIFSGNGTVNVGGSFLSTAGATFTCGSGTVNYNGAAQGITGFTYNNLTLSGSVAKTLAGNVIIGGMCTINGAASTALTIGANTLTLNGGLTTTSGTLVGGNTSSLVMGASATLPSSLTALLNLTLNAGTTSLSGSLIVSTATSGVLSLNGGIILTTSTNLLSANNRASAGVVWNGSYSSYVDGPLQRRFGASQAGDNIFPVGKNGNCYPFTLSSPSMVAATDIRIEAFGSNCGGSIGTDFYTISTTEYWQAQVISGTFTNGTISLNRQLAISPNDAIGNSTVVNAAKTGYGSTTSGNTITSVSPITTLGFFVMGHRKPKIYFVNDGSLSGDIFCSTFGNNTNNGLTGATPKLTLKNLWNTYGPAGTNALTAGDTIKIDAGTYSYDNGDIDQSDDEHNFNITVAGLTFKGAGWNKTIFDHNFIGTNTDYFMYISADNVSVFDLQITEFENQGTQFPGHSGQAITIGGATGVLFDHVFLNNNGQSGGNPAISVLANSSATFRFGGSTCNVWETQYTGGIEAFGNNITLNIEDYVLAYNYKNGAYDGGGLLISNANSTTTVNVIRTKFFNNKASDGGGISQRGGILNMTDCIVESNYAGQTSTPVYGGGYRVYEGTATLTRVKFLNNGENSSVSGSTLRGGAIGAFSNDGPVSLTLNNCYFSGNTGDEGDDLYADKSFSNAINISATNTTFSSSANAIFNKDANIQLTNCGDPLIDGSNSPAVIKNNVAAPSSIPNPITASFSGECGTIVLPVELIDFTGICEQTHTKLAWATATEHNNDYFTIEHAGSDAQFSVLAQINGQMNSTTKSEYVYNDYYALPGINYYKLSQTDVDGAKRIVKTISVDNNCLTANELEISCSFNSTSNSLNIGYFIEQNEVVEASVYNLAGQLIQQSELILIASDRRTQLQLRNSLPFGMYFLKLSNEKFMVSDRVMIISNN